MPVSAGIFAFAEPLSRQFLQSTAMAQAVRLMALLLPLGSISACLKGYFNAVCRVHNYKQGTINKHLELPSYEAHRACEDSAALGRIFCVMLSDLAEKEVTTVEGINTGLGGNREVLKKKYTSYILPRSMDYISQSSAPVTDLHM